MIGGGDLRVEVFDGRGQITGQHLTGIMVQGQHRRAFRIDVPLEEAVANQGQRMRNKRHPQAVLLNVLGVGTVHQAPTPDEFHPGQVGEEMAHHTPPEAFQFVKDW
jgi:hypothetical protein